MPSNQLVTIAHHLNVVGMTVYCRWIDAQLARDNSMLGFYFVVWHGLIQHPALSQILTGRTHENRNRSDLSFTKVTLASNGWLYSTERRRPAAFAALSARVSQAADDLGCCLTCFPESYYWVSLIVRW